MTKDKLEICNSLNNKIKDIEKAIKDFQDIENVEQIIISTTNTSLLISIDDKNVIETVLTTTIDHKVKELQLLKRQFDQL